MWLPSKLTVALQTLVQVMASMGPELRQTCIRFVFEDSKSKMKNNDDFERREIKKSFKFLKTCT